MTTQDYLNLILKEFKSGHATEHSYRPALKQYLEALLPNVQATNEPKRQKCGAPDYILTKKKIPIAFIEAKDIGISLAKEQKSNQMKRYLASLENLCQTDIFPIDELIFKGISNEVINSWEWKFNDGSPNEYAQIVNHAFCNEGEYIVELTVEKSDGSIVTISETVTVASPGVLPLQVHIKDAVTCSGSSVTFETKPYTCGGNVINVPIIGGSGDYKISWYPKRGLKNSNTALPTILRASKSTFYMIQVLDRKTGQLIKKRINVNVQRQPVIKMIRRVNTKSGEIIQLGKYARCLPENSNYTFNWTDKKGWTSTEENPEIEAFTSKRYYLTINNENDCISREQSLYVRVSRHKEAFVDTVQTQAQELPAENPYECNVYPNPAKEFVNIELFFEETTNVKILITNLVGRSFFELEEGGNDTYMFTINVKDIQQGIYAIRIEAGDIVIHERFIRE